MASQLTTQTCDLQHPGALIACYKQTKCPGLTHRNSFISPLTGALWPRRHVQLALKLLHERRLGPASRLAPYVAALPRAYSTPLAWGEGELAALQYPHLQQQVLSHRPRRPCQHPPSEKSWLDVARKRSRAVRFFLGYRFSPLETLQSRMRAGAAGHA